MNFTQGSSSPQLAQIYSCIQLNPQNPFERDFDEAVFDLVDEFIQAHEDTDYIQYIIDNSAGENTHKVGCLLSILIWSTKDNGEKIQRWRGLSLDNENQRAIEIALCITDVFPMADLNACINKLKEIALKFPQTEPLCDYWIDLAQKELLRNAGIRNRGFKEKIAAAFKKWLA
ncbi:MAG: hypothetical protein JNJ57_11515 [Saprospiraceae bacterium]|nr:hypothetical protein [Saprospiraceae bacterium]